MGTVSGLVLSSSSHPEDCRLRVWNLKTQAAVISVLLSEGRPESPTCLHMRDHGALVAVALDDGALQVVNLHGKASPQPVLFADVSFLIDLPCREQHTGVGQQISLRSIGDSTPPETRAEVADKLGRTWSWS